MAGALHPGRLRADGGRLRQRRGGRPHLRLPRPVRDRVCFAVAVGPVIAWGNLRGCESPGRSSPPRCTSTWWRCSACWPTASSASPPGTPPRIVPPPDDPAHAHGVQALGLFLILRAFASGAVGLTGHRGRGGRRGGLQAPGGPQRPHRPGDHGHLLRDRLRGDQLPGQLDRDRPRPGRGGDGQQPAHPHPGGDRPLLLPGAVRHRPAPGPGGEHRLRRLPPPGDLHGPGQVPPQPLRLPRRAPGLHQRDHRPGHRGRPADRRLPGQRHGPDPALHRGRLHRLHPLPGRHRGALLAPAGAGLGLAHRRQRDGGGDHRRRRHRGGGDQVRPGRVGGAGPDPAPGAAAAGDPDATTPSPATSSPSPRRTCVPAPTSTPTSCSTSS